MTKQQIFNIIWCKSHLFFVILQKIQKHGRRHQVEATICKLQKGFAEIEQGCRSDVNEVRYGKDVDELLREGLIQRFEYTHELAWNVMKDYAEYQGYTDVRGSRSAIRMGFEMNLITDKAWMETIGDRNLTSHNYDEETAEVIYESIVNIYHPLFCDFEKKMEQIEKEEL